MKNKEYLKEQFTKYLKGEISAGEAEQLLKHIRSGRDREYIKFLIAENLDNPVSEEISANLDVQNRLELTHNLLRERIQRGRIVKIRRLWLSGVAASLALFLVSGWLLHKQLYDLLHPIHLETVSTLKGEHKELTLADGSVIEIGPGSTFQYPDEFNRDTREVKLSGAAFFEVAKDKKHPFIVHTGNVSTRVLGTSFHIQAYKEDADIKVILFTGKVALNSGKEHNQLLPGQEGIFDKYRQTIRRQAYPDTAKFLAQRNGDFEYDGEPVAEVIADMQREFNVAIIPQGDVLSQNFYGSFAIKDGLDIALKKLCITIGAKYELQGNAVIISPARHN